MDFVQNFPAVSILLCLFAGIISSGLRKKAARCVNIILIVLVKILSVCSIFYDMSRGDGFV